MVDMILIWKIDLKYCQEIFNCIEINIKCNFNLI